MAPWHWGGDPQFPLLPKSPKARRVRDQEDDEWLTEKEIEDEEERRRKQKKRKVEDRELCTLQEKVGSLRTLFEMKEMSEKTGRMRRGAVTSRKPG